MLTRFVWLALTTLLVTAVVACGGGGGDDDDDDDDGDGTPTPGESIDPSGEPVGVEDLAHAVVQIVAIAGGDPVWTGSGTILTPDGLILTNAHVVDNRFDEYDELHVAVTVETDEPADPRYVGEVLAVDYNLDLAVMQITEDLEGGEILEDFPFVEIGDSDEVEIGDDIRILGYPGIGGQTITFTNGVVSGFTAERSVGNRAWIKTDATIAGGNSGGLAVNEDGQIIGVPTVVGSGAGAETGYVDCRVLEDTNGDGFLDENDSCIPVGGFINGLRPVKLAQDLLVAAESGEEYVSPYYEEDDIEETPTGGYDASEVDLFGLVFSDGVTEDDEPESIEVVFPSLVPRVCGFWEYEGMEDGMVWDALWYVDGELNDGGSIIADTWVGGESGSWWVCIVDEEAGLADGLYELILQIEGEPFGSDAVFVGDDRVEIELDISNESDVEICAAWVSPQGAQNWGFEDLGADVTVPPGEFAPVFIGSGIHDIQLYDCDAELLYEDYGLEIFEDSTYTYTGP
jgi:S1-C subfamily serine protease